jgi:hypothetical protein
MGKTSIVRKRSGVVRVSQIFGGRVESADGEHLGKIEDLAIDHLQGRVAYAILSFSEGLGLGNKLFAAPLPALSYRPTEDTFVLHVDKETLKRAPGFERSQWPDMSDRAWGEEIYAHYGYSPYWE